MTDWRHVLLRCLLTWLTYATAIGLLVVLFCAAVAP